MADPKCQVHIKVGGPECGNPAPHIWGKLPLCCPHFDALVEAIFEARSLVEARIHADFVRIYEERTHQSSTIENVVSICKAKKKGGESDT